MSDPYRAASDRADALMAMDELEIELAASAEKLRLAQYEQYLLVQRWWKLNTGGGKHMGYRAPPSSWFRQVPTTIRSPDPDPADGNIAQRLLIRHVERWNTADAEAFVRFLIAEAEKY